MEQSPTSYSRNNQHYGCSKQNFTSTPVVQTGVYPHMPIADRRETQIVYNTGRHRPRGGMFVAPHTVRGCPAKFVAPG